MNQHRMKLVILVVFGLCAALSLFACEGQSTTVIIFDDEDAGSDACPDGEADAGAGCEGVGGSSPTS